jgi:protoporphyrinogen oxidase
MSINVYHDLSVPPHPMPLSGEHPVRIVGGGMMGLTLGLRLARRGYRVVVHERDPYLGGLSGESAVAGVPVERFYHCVLPADGSLLALLDEIGLGGEVGWTKTRTGFFHDRRLLEMTSTADFFRFPALHLSDRIRLGWTIAYCASRSQGDRFDREPIGPFLRRHGGTRLFEAIWEPLLVAKLGSDYDRFAASFIWATVKRMLSARQAGGNAEKLGFVQGRYGKVFAALRSSLEARGGTVVTGSAVSGISRGTGSEPGWSLQVDGDDVPASGIILCVPAPVAATWVRPLLPECAGRLDEVQYLGVVCEVLVMKRPLSPYYILNLTDRSIPLTGVIEMSNLTGVGEFDGKSVVYLPRYRDQASALWNRGDEEIHEESVAGLSRMFPGFRSDDIIGWQVNRARHVQPVHPVGWADRIPPVRLAPGLAYLSTAHIHPWPVFNNEVLNTIGRNIDTVMKTLSEHREPAHS